MRVRRSHLIGRESDLSMEVTLAEGLSLGHFAKTERTGFAKSVPGLCAFTTASGSWLEVAFK